MESSGQSGQAGASGEAQALANNLVEAAQKVANQAIDLGEGAAGAVFDSLLTANKLVTDALEALRSKVVG